MEVTVRDYNDRLNEMTQQYERLEKKDELVNRVLKDTDTSFTMLKDLETRLKDCSRQITSLPQEIRDVQANVDRLLKNGPKITEATSKLEELDTLLSETRKNIDIVNSANLGIKKTEQDLQELSRGVEKKFEVLHKITKEDLSSGNTPKDKSFTPSEKETIRDLKRQGWTINELASRFKRSITEIELLLDLPED
jgi:prefoldin subunit 5